MQRNISQGAFEILQACSYSSPVFDDEDLERGRTRASIQLSQVRTEYMKTDGSSRGGKVSADKEMALLIALFATSSMKINQAYPITKNQNVVLPDPVRYQRKRTGEKESRF